jgi:Fe-S oxidoreductase
MALKDFENYMLRCNRCSYCKIVPHAMLRSLEHESICPSIARYIFHGYSGGGRTIAALSLLRERLDYSEAFLDMIYRCQMDGGCDVACKTNRDLEPLEVMLELRARCVEEGQLLPAHMVVMDGLRKEDNMMQGKKVNRGNWAEGLKVKDLTKEKAEVLYHAGCRLSFDEELWPVARRAVILLSKAGVDVGIMGKEEACCGGRAYEWGYQGELTKYAEHNAQTWQSLGIKKVVTSCSCCYQTFKVLYDKIGKKSAVVEVLHITEYLDRLIKEGRLKLTKEVPLKVTYHDPCHLGRLAEPWIHWEGKEVKVLGQLVVYDPPKEFRRGAKGVYEPPRNIIKAIPGLNLVEMDRIREYAWCCGAGGGVQEAYPDFAVWTATERLKEAEATGAEALVTACPWCERNFTDAVNANGHQIKVYDLVELLEKAI